MLDSEKSREGKDRVVVVEGRETRASQVPSCPNQNKHDACVPRDVCLSQSGDCWALNFRLRPVRSTLLDLEDFFAARRALLKLWHK